ncbi:accessory gene regulator B family protein [Anaeromicropila populeti]|uniref:Accessory gene regulator B n=1 Tax=Anaeromicropila populeti TaxID=37658 RepID=A0A1I6K9K3_9FIRM|nr:accessory gene regulator B family protein [Anaeromicropila populeti]SFR87911.1 Accessory gene regulator B [Anaeromicropila populeti]
MLKKISEKIADIIIDNGHNKEDREIYVYGIQIILSTMFTLSIVYIIAFATKHVLQMSCYFACFIPFRRCAGGYHAKKFWGCCIVTVFSSVAGIFLGEYLYYSKSELLAPCFLISLLVIWIYAPVSNQNRQLKVFEIPKYKKLTKQIGIFYSLIIVLLYSFNLGYWSSFMVMAIMVTAAALIVGNMERRKMNEKSN